MFSQHDSIRGASQQRGAGQSADRHDNPDGIKPAAQVGEDLLGGLHASPGAVQNQVQLPAVRPRGGGHEAAGILPAQLQHPPGVIALGKSRSVENGGAPGVLVQPLQVLLQHGVLGTLLPASLHFGVNLMERRHFSSPCRDYCQDSSTSSASFRSSSWLSVLPDRPFSSPMAQLINSRASSRSDIFLRVTAAS